jgi:eukaryotic-like serine/threonine-protein kinase
MTSHSRFSGAPVLDMSSNESRKEVIDELGRRFELGRQLGVGGQGAVFEVPGSRLVVKVLRGGSEAERGRLEERIRFIRRLALDDLPVARPIAPLRHPALGYVMELMDQMEPLEMLLPRTGAPLSVDSFRSSGGLRRRLRLLARTADILAALHSRGLVYGDVSTKNVLISDTATADEVQLIDPDNIAYWSAPDIGGAYTPKFGAPELVARRTGHTSLTDAHAFAVMACWVLRGVHPLLGDEVLEGEPELEEEALAGALPWIDDTIDRSNATVHGVPAGLVYSQYLRDLAARAFGPGMRSPAARPAITEWAERLHGASAMVLDCPDCGGDFYANRTECPWCDQPRPPHVLGHVWIRDPEWNVGSLDSTRVGLFAVGPDKPMRMPTYLIHDGAPGPVPSVTVQWDGKHLGIHVLEGSGVWLERGAKSTPMNASAIKIAARELKGVALHMRSDEHRHRAVSFGLRKAGT